jgi:catalase
LSGKLQHPGHGEYDRHSDERLTGDGLVIPQVQPGNLFRLFNSEQKQRLFANIAAAMQGVPDEIKRRQVALFAQCDPAYGEGVAKALKLE